MTLVEKDQFILSTRKSIFKSLWYPIILFVTVLISYGQTLWMDVWRDAHAIFFKFNHLYERTGYLGNGILGEGTYRFSVAPYWFIYKLVGYSQIWPYYLLNLFFYFFAALSIYYLFSKLLNQKSGRIAGLLFAAGYIAVEGFIDLAGSMIFNVSIILLCCCLLAYLNYFQTRRYKFYILSLGIYVLAIFLTPVRTHYFIGVLILFDLLWFQGKKIILRLIPFAVMFYLIFLQSADSRTGSMLQFIKDVLSGKIYNLYSFFGSLGYLFVSDKYINFIASFRNFRLAEILISGIALALTFWFSRKSPWLKIRFAISLGLTFVWFYLTKIILAAPQLNPGLEAMLAVFIGGMILIIIGNALVCGNKDIKRYLILLFGWLILNLITYAAYDPISIVSTVDRYIVHSFVPLVGLLALVFYTRGRLLWLVILWGGLNLINGVVYQHNVLFTRSFPARDFHSSLQRFVPKINKGDILYVDVADNARSQFRAAFTVGQMPEETAIAWRYGIDRYDFRLITEFPDLINAINKEKASLSQVYTFHYSMNGLENTTNRFREILSTQSKDFVAANPIEGFTPMELRVQLIAKPTDISRLKFPLIQNSSLTSNNVARNVSLRLEAKDYGEEISSQRHKTTIVTSSDWHENSPLSINDGDVDTAWRADRFIWADTDHAGFTMELPNPLNVDRLVWVNAYPNHSPIEYQILTSLDDRNWTIVKTYKSVRRLPAGEMQIEKFSPQLVRYLKIDITKTLSDDSPGISETWVVPSKYSNLNLVEVEQYLNDPMGYVDDSESFIETLKALNYTGKVQFSWQDNSTNKLVSLPSLLVPIIYDGQPHEYSLIVPARGTKFSDFKITFSQIPGVVQISKIKFRYLTLTELSDHN